MKQVDTNNTSNQSIAFDGYDPRFGHHLPSQDPLYLAVKAMKEQHARTSTTQHSTNVQHQPSQRKTQ